MTTPSGRSFAAMTIGTVGSPDIRHPLASRSTTDTATLATSIARPTARLTRFIATPPIRGCHFGAAQRELLQEPRHLVQHPRRLLAVRDMPAPVENDEP